MNPTAFTSTTLLPASSSTAVRGTTPFRRAEENGREQADLARTERDELTGLPTTREVVGAGAGAPPATGVERTAASSDDPYRAWRERARAAGHDVLDVLPGRFDPELLPVWSWSMPPNDLLDVAREYARAAVPWVHVVLPTQGALLTLHRSIVGPRPTGPRRRRGGPTGMPWYRLVRQQQVGPRAITDIRDGRARHVLELPVVWLAYPILPPGPRDGHRPAIERGRPTRRRPSTGRG